MALLETVILFAIVLVAIGVVLYVVIVYNSLVRLRKDIDRTWANIDVILKQRNDELTKLLNTVKGYMKYEKDLLNQLTKLRTDFLKAKSIPDKARVSNQLTAALRTLFAVAENYPNLKANESFLQLQSRISGLENELADRRELYNNSVTEFNIRINQIPDKFVAGMLGYNTPQQLFKVSEAEKADIKIKF